MMRTTTTVVEHAHRKVTCVRPREDDGADVVASGGADGSVETWCAKTGRTKRRFEKVLSGAIRDICWSFDGSKIAVVGEGKEAFARVIHAEMGTTVKDVGGATAWCKSACGSRSGKPHRVVIGSDDFRVRFYKGGPPFQLETTKQHHGKYINEVRMSKDDKYVISAAGDGIGVWDVETMELIGKVAAKDGSTYGVAWLNGSDHLFVSCGADKTVKLWNVKDVVAEREVGVDVEMMVTEEETVRLVAKTRTEQVVTKRVTREDTYTMGAGKITTTKPSVDDMQIGVCASDDTIVSFGLSGKMTVLDVFDSEEGKKTRLRFREEILGHSRPITAMCSIDISSSSSTTKRYQIWTASIRREDDPRPKILVCDYVPETKSIENVEEVTKNSPQKKVTKMVCCSDDIVAAIGFDDSLRFASITEKTFWESDDDDNCCVKFDQQPIDVCVASSRSLPSKNDDVAAVEHEEEEKEEDSSTVPVSRVTTVQCELLVTLANGCAKLVPIEYEKSTSRDDDDDDDGILDVVGGLKILRDKIRQIDVTSTTKKKEVELSCGCAVQIFDDGGKSATMTSMTTTTLFAFGSADKAVVHVFERRNDGDIEHKQTLERSNVTSCNITCVAFSPDGKHLAIGDSNREVILWSSDIRGEDDDEEEEEEEEEAHISRKFQLLKLHDRRHSKFFHTSRVEDIQWSRSSSSFLSCSLDGHAKIWRNVVGKTHPVDIADVTAVDGGARVARFLYTTTTDEDASNKTSKQQSEPGVIKKEGCFCDDDVVVDDDDDGVTASAHLVCVGADCAVRFFSPSSS
jgi:WD40 repeat protein